MVQKEKKKKLNDEVNRITHKFNPLLDLVNAMNYLKTKKEK